MTGERVDQLKASVMDVFDSNRGFFVDSTQYMLCRTAVSAVIDAVVSAEGDPFIQRIDVLDLLIDALQGHEKTLDGIVAQMDNVLNTRGELMKGRKLGKRVVVRSQNRLTLAEIPEGTVVNIEYRYRRSGEIGGAELWVVG